MNAHASTFESVNLQDKRAVLDWLKLMFELCVAARQRMPDGENIANRLEVYYKGAYDAQTDRCPQDIDGRLDWLLGLYLKAIRIAYDDYYLYYATAVSITKHALEGEAKPA